MTRLPFQTYEEATAYFGIAMPRLFFDKLMTIDQFCAANEFDTGDVLFELFGILRIEGEEARYQQTPIEFFPFGSIGSDGIHYGFIMHTLQEEDYPSGELSPMEAEGIQLIGNNSKELFQNLLQQDIDLQTFRPLLNALDIHPLLANDTRDQGSSNSLQIYPAKGWRFLATTDGTGVYAEEHFFDEHHETRYQAFNGDVAIEQYEELASDMQRQGFYASQLYYLKELYWYEWPNYELAKKYLRMMSSVYQKLNRPHLQERAQQCLSDFDKKYSV